MQKIIKYLGRLYISIIRFFVRREEKSILFLPHDNCKTDGYDILNYSSDNVLSLLHEMLDDERFDGWHFYVVLQNPSLLQSYNKFILSNIKRKGKISWVADNRLSICRRLIRVSVCFTDHPHYEFSFARNGQLVVSLGYFTPFKFDYYPLLSLSPKQYLSLQRKINKSFDYHITTSDLSSRIISGDTLLLYSKFKPFGFPRNDMLKIKSLEKDSRSIINGLNLGEIRFVFCYTPTYRDYEREDLPLYDSSMKGRNFLNSNIELSSLNDMLEENNSILITKFHPWQEQSYSLKSYSRIIPFSYFRNNKLGLYDILAISDCLITDYTSTCFDYLNLNRPIIYYMYDFEYYKINRGFSFNPVDVICCGDVVYNTDELFGAMQNIMNGEDKYIQKRRYVQSLMNAHNDTFSGKRIMDFLMGSI